MRALVLAVALSLGSCAALLNTPVQAYDPVTGEPIEVPLGDVIANNAESFGSTAGKAATTVTGNPLLGLIIAGVGATIAEAARRKKAAAYEGPGDTVPK